MKNKNKRTKKKKQTIKPKTNKKGIKNKKYKIKSHVYLIICFC